MEIVGLMRFRWNRFQHAIINNSVLASLSDEDVLLLAKIIALLFSNLRNSRGVSKEYLYLVDEHWNFFTLEAFNFSKDEKSCLDLSPPIEDESSLRKRDT